MGSAIKNGFSVAAGAEVGTSWVTFALNGHVATDTKAEDIPNHAHILDVGVQFTTLAGGAATATMLLSRDAAGDRPIKTAAVALVVGKTTPTSGAVWTSVGSQHPPRTAGDVPGTLYLHIKVDAGTILVTQARGHWKVER